MLEIAICDDQRSCVDDAYRHVKRILAQKNIEVRFTAYSSGKGLLDSEVNYDIVLLDIDMPGMDGIETGKRLRQKDEKCKIIMVTSKVERYKDAFRFQAFRFVTKPIDPREIGEAITAAVRVPIGSERISLFLNRIQYEVPQRDISYVRAFNGYTEFVVGGKVFRREESLSAIAEELNDKLFFRVNRQYIVNMGAITDIDSTSIRIGGEEFSLATRARKQFEKEYMEFDVKYGLNT